MCTVSYIPGGQNKEFILTSNRDEKMLRQTLAPDIYDIGKTRVGYPSDVKAGGSWIAVSDNGRVSCLLNGAFEAHQKQDFYTQSRGKVLIELAASDAEPGKFFSRKDLSGVEPFTIVTIDKVNRIIRGFLEFKWDGENKYSRALDPGQPYIWSSVTLYNLENRASRRNWFKQFIADHSPDISPDNVYQFHAGNHTSNQAINLIMEREGGLRTVSITQVIPEENQLMMKYSDLLDNALHEIVL